MTKSLQKKIAKEVLVICKEKKTVGVVTLAEKKSHGQIGLLAVDTSCRGQSYGKKLVHAANNWFMEQGYKQGQVVTQGHNTTAINLYKKCGYTLKQQHYFFHFWL